MTSLNAFSLNSIKKALGCDIKISLFQHSDKIPKTEDPQAGYTMETEAGRVWRVGNLFKDNYLIEFIKESE